MSNPKKPFGYAHQVGEPDELSTAEFWDAIYDGEEGGPKWDLGQPAPPLASLFASGRLPLAPPGRILVPGCGWGSEVRLAAEHGFHAVGLDFAERAIEGARARVTHPSAAFLRGDFFALPDDPQHRGQYDALIEHTCFVAINPARRGEYARACHGVLRDGGWLLALFYNHGREGGPPFDTTEADIHSHFGPLFTIESLEKAPDSMERRAGMEWLGILRRKPV